MPIYSHIDAPLIIPFEGLRTVILGVLLVKVGHPVTEVLAYAVKRSLALRRIPIGSAVVVAVSDR